MARKRSTTTVDDNITTDDITTDDDAAVEAADAAADAQAEAAQEPAEPTESAPEPAADAPATDEARPGIWELELINPRTRQPEVHQVPGATEEEARANIRASFQEVGGTIRRVV